MMLSLLLLWSLGTSQAAEPVKLENGVSHLKAYSTFGDEDPYYSGSGLCSDCHDGLSTSTAEDISIVRQWSNSMMANATIDPYWQAKVASELKRNPQLSDTINDKCSRCHAPMANDAATKNGDPIQILGTGGFLDPASPYYQHAQEGVSCTLCHQITDNGLLGTLDGFSGHWEVDTYTYATISQRPAYGQYNDPLTAPMINQVDFTPAGATHIQDSAFCATCHDLNTPFVDANGNIASTTPDTEFPEQSPYREWAHSAYSDTGATPTSCQQCHMPEVNEAVKISTRPNNLSPRSGFSRHVFVGANTTMLQLLADNNLAPTSYDLPGYIALTRSFLQQAASLSLNTPLYLDGLLDFTVQVNNHSGHKLPSGYPSRRVWLEVQITDGNGNTLFHSGAPNADGSIQGVDLDSDSTTYEPHYTEITQAGQVQVYEPIMGNTDGQVTHTLLRASHYIKDNRLLPAGFDKATAPADVAVRGLAATDPDFTAGGDQVRYRLSLADLPEVEIQLRLRYQTLSFGHLQDLFTDSDQAEVATFESQFNTASIRSEILAEATLRVANERAFRDSFE